MEKVKNRLSSQMSRHLRRGRTFPDEATALRYYRRNHLRFLAELPEGPILDVGCGLGDFLAFASADLRQNVVGVDLAEQNVAVCRDRGLQAVQGDVLHLLRDRDCQYAAIVLNDVLEHFDKQDVLRLLDLVHARLQTQGRLIAKVPNMNNPLTAARTLFADFTHGVAFTEQSLVQVLEATGFRDISLAPVDIYVTGNPVLNIAGRVAAGAQHFVWRLLYRLNGVTSTTILTKTLIACAVKTVGDNSRTGEGPS